ncbi:MAG: aminotransferase class V-fold PLP-dependent enzyme [Bacillota bacterium]
MRKIYLDNAATTKKKPENVKKAILNYYENIGCSPGRGGYEDSIKAGRVILNARAKIANFFNVPNPEQIIFTHNVTYALNMGLKGILKNNDHVITTTMEHNSVLRPLHSLEKKEIIEVDYVKCNKDGSLDPDKIKNYIKDNTKVIVITYASNVTGTLMPVKEISEIADKNDIYFILDTAQAAGLYDIDFQELKTDILAFTGHKGLMGPPGTGGFAVSKNIAKNMDSLIEGGTGSISDKEYQPDFLPDKFESGTMNTPGIAALKAGIDFIEKTGLKNIRKHELKLAQKFINGLKENNKIKIFGPANHKKQAPTISIQYEDLDMGEMSYMLDDKYGIMTRSGLHCAPFAHKTIASFPEGTLRFSIGYFNTEKEIDYTLEKLNEF